jgi:TetR/AcrR family transcriptional repressor of nem operon
MSTRAPDETRKRILTAAFLEFYQNGFQGGSINNIVTSAGVTKGALFHHFASKQELGYAVVDEVIGTLQKVRWQDPLEGSSDPVTSMRDALLAAYQMEVEHGQYSGLLLHGCPLNNISQEMSPLDEGIRARTNGLYSGWRGSVAEALRRGQAAGTVRPEVNADSAAAFIVAAHMGIFGTAKNSQSAELLRESAYGLLDYLETLRTPKSDCTLQPAA